MKTGKRPRVGIEAKEMFCEIPRLCSSHINIWSRDFPHSVYLGSVVFLTTFSYPPCLSLQSLEAKERKQSQVQESGGSECLPLNPW